jgi:hypothetical protein
LRLEATLNKDDAGHVNLSDSKIEKTDITEHIIANAETKDDE